MTRTLREIVLDKEHALIYFTGLMPAFSPMISPSFAPSPMRDFGPPRLDLDRCSFNYLPSVSAGIREPINSFEPRFDYTQISNFAQKWTNDMGLGGASTRISPAFHYQTDNAITRPEFGFADLRTYDAIGDSLINPIVVHTASTLGSTARYGTFMNDFKVGPELDFLSRHDNDIKLPTFGYSTRINDSLLKIGMGGISAKPIDFTLTPLTDYSPKIDFGLIKAPLISTSVLDATPEPFNILSHLNLSKTADTWNRYAGIVTANISDSLFLKPYVLHSDTESMNLHKGLYTTRISDALFSGISDKLKINTDDIYLPGLSINEPLPSIWKPLITHNNDSERFDPLASTYQYLTPSKRMNTGMIDIDIKTSGLVTPKMPTFNPVTNIFEPQTAQNELLSDPVTSFLKRQSTGISRPFLLDQQPDIDLETAAFGLRVLDPIKRFDTYMPDVPIMVNDDYNLRLTNAHQKLAAFGTENGVSLNVNPTGNLDRWSRFVEADDNNLVPTYLERINKLTEPNGIGQAIVDNAKLFDCQNYVLENGVHITPFEEINSRPVFGAFTPFDALNDATRETGNSIQLPLFYQPRLEQFEPIPDELIKSTIIPHEMSHSQTMQYLGRAHDILDVTPFTGDDKEFRAHRLGYPLFEALADANATQKLAPENLDGYREGLQTLFAPALTSDPEVFSKRLYTADDTINPGTVSSLVDMKMKAVYLDLPQVSNFCDRVFSHAQFGRMEGNTFVPTSPRGEALVSVIDSLKTLPTYDLTPGNSANIDRLTEELNVAARNLLRVYGNGDEQRGFDSLSPDTGLKFSRYRSNADSTRSGLECGIDMFSHTSPTHLNNLEGVVSA